MVEVVLIDSPERRRANLMALVDEGILSEEAFDAEVARIDRERTHAADDLRPLVTLSEQESARQRCGSMSSWIAGRAAT